MDPWTQAILWICGIALALLTWGAIDELWQRRAPKPEPPTDEPADDSVQDGPPCMVTHPHACTNTATHDTWGWLTCDTHAPRRAA